MNTQRIARSIVKAAGRDAVLITPEDGCIRVESPYGLPTEQYLIMGCIRDRMPATLRARATLINDARYPYLRIV